MIDRLFNPYEEPEERYVPNHQGVDPVMTALSLVPIGGIGIILGSFVYAVGDGNEFNIANEAWNTGMVGLLFQLFYAVIFAVMYL